MRQALWTRASCAKKSHQKPFRLAAFSQYAKQATSVRRAEARPTRKSRVCLAWRLSIIREAGDAAPVG